MLAAAGRKGKVRAAGLFPVAGGGGRSGSAAGHLPFGRGSNLATSQQRNQLGVVPTADAARRLPSSGSSPAAGVLAVGRGSSPSGGVPVGLGSDPAAGGVLPIFPNTGGNNGSPASPTNTFPSQSWWCSDPSWENNPHPPGGFMGILNSKDNLHFVGSPSDVEILSDKQAVEDENVRTGKRILWTPKEDEELMSAWIEHSTDSTMGADRKGEAY